MSFVPLKRLVGVRAEGRARSAPRAGEWDCANLLALSMQLMSVDLSVCTLFIRMFTYKFSRT